MKLGKQHIILALAILSFLVALVDTAAGIYVAVFANVIANYITVSRQKAKIVKLREKKEKSSTVDEFREAEMNAHPHRPYPRHDTWK